MPSFDIPTSHSAQLQSTSIPIIVGVTTIGTDAADTITGTDGNDVIEGRGGNDWIFDGAGDDMIDGGDGDDILTSSLGNDVLRGGAGNDELRVTNDSSSSEAQSVLLFGDAGADHFILLPGLNPALTVTMEGGVGSDIFTIGTRAHSGLTILDFGAGPGGDILDLFGLALWSGATTPASVDYRLVQRGADTLVQSNDDGSGYLDVVTLKNLNKILLTSDNFMGGITPSGLGGSGVIEGSAGSVNYTGTALDDKIVGGSGNDTLSGGAGNDEIIGNAGDDYIDGGPGDDILSGGLGNDRIFGGAGIDTVRLDAPLSSYRITRIGQDIELFALGDAAPFGVDILNGVERLTFGTTGLALDIDGAAGQIYRLYRAAFDRTPDQRGVGYWLDKMDKGATFGSVAQAFVESQEFANLNLSVLGGGAIVRNLYQHVLHREPDLEGLAYWIAALDSQRASIADVLSAFSESVENQSAVAVLIANGVHYEF